MKASNEIRVGIVVVAALLASASHAWAERALRHTNVRCIAFSPNGKLLASGGGEYASPGEARIWNLSGGKLRHTMKYEYSVTDVAFSPDGSTLAIVSNGEIQLRNTGSWKIRRTIKAAHLQSDLTDMMTSVAFSSDGKIIANSNGFTEVGTTGKIRLWETASGKLKQTLPLSNGPSQVAFTLDGSTLLAAVGTSDDGKDKGGVRMWDVKSGRLKKTLEFPNATEIAIAPDGKSFVAARSYSAKGRTVGAIQMWDARTEKRRWLRWRPRFVLAATWSSRKNRIATMSGSGYGKGADGKVILWNAASGQALKSWPIAAGYTYELDFSPDGKTLAATDMKNGMIKLWRVGNI